MVAVSGFSASDRTVTLPYFLSHRPLLDKSYFSLVVVRHGIINRCKSKQIMIMFVKKSVVFLCFPIQF